VQEAEVERLRALAKLRHDELDALTVRADVRRAAPPCPSKSAPRSSPAPTSPASPIPTKLKAEVRIAETQAKDIAIGQLASIDTRNGIVEGRVARIDPAVQNGTVTVDVTITGELPKGARPDLSVDGTIELERLDDVVYVGRPAFGQEKSTVGIFKLDGDKTASDAAARRCSSAAARSTPSRSSSGLQPGDWVILSDMSQWDANDRIR
jgi:HlyD family secretion protein